jgi:hypothetical protein
MTSKFLAAALGLAIFVTLAGCVVAVPALPAAPNVPPIAPAFDTALPAPQAPFDTTPITAVETVGASRTE